MGRMLKLMGNVSPTPREAFLTLMERRGVKQGSLVPKLLWSFSSLHCHPETPLTPPVSPLSSPSLPSSLPSSSPFFCPPPPTLSPTGLLHLLTLISLETSSCRSHLCPCCSFFHATRIHASAEGAGLSCLLGFTVGPGYKLH